MEETVLAFRLEVLCEGEGHAVSWMVDGSWSILDVKDKIYELEGTHPDQQKLFWKEEELTRNDDCLFDLKHHWDSSDTLLVLEMRISWRSPMSTKERDEGRSRSRSRTPEARSPVPSDLENENCIF